MKKKPVKKKKSVKKQTKQQKLGLTNASHTLFGTDLGKLKAELETPNHQLIMLVDMAKQKEGGKGEAVSMLALEMVQLHERFALLAMEMLSKLKLNARLKTMVVVDG